MKANPAYQVRMPHDPRKILAVSGALVEHTAEVSRLITACDVETEDQRKSKRKRKRKTTKERKG